MRLEMFDDGSGDTARVLRTYDLRVPFAVPRTSAGPALAELVDSGIPVYVTEQIPTVLNELWGETVADPILRALQVRYTAVAPITGIHGPEGVLLWCVVNDWPIDVAAECAAHAAVAIANVCELRGAASAAGRDPETGLHARAVVEDLAEREINRAARYRRMLSLAVIELPNQQPEYVKQTATLVARVMRLPDTAARLDAGRLVVLLPETPAGGSDAFIRRLRDHGEARLEPLAAGGATYPQDGATWDELLTVAIRRTHEPAAPSATVLPGASIRGSLRAAFPSLRGAPDRSGRVGF
jgi:GGDEF domain-containing protein